MAKFPLGYYDLPTQVPSATQSGYTFFLAMKHWAEGSALYNSCGISVANDTITKHRYTLSLRKVLGSQMKG